MKKKEKEQDEKVPVNNKLKEEDLNLYHTVQNIKKISLKNKSIIVSMDQQKNYYFHLNLFIFYQLK